MTLEDSRARVAAGPSSEHCASDNAKGPRQRMFWLLDRQLEQMGACSNDLHVHSEGCGCILGIDSHDVKGGVRLKMFAL